MARINPVSIESLPPGRHYDEHGLFLSVDKRGRRIWYQRYTIRGRRRCNELGSYPELSEAEARRLALANQRVVAQGQDPFLKKTREAIPTFAVAAMAVVEQRRPSWSEKEGEDWLRAFRLHVFPKIGDTLVSEITTAQLLELVTGIQNTNLPTGRRALRYISTVMDVAVVQGYRDDNPAGETLLAALPKRRAEVEHHPSVPHAQAPAVLVAIRTSGAWIFTRLALVFLILTGARSGEARGAVWDEIKLNERLWIIPEERMKHGEEHRVALSAHAIAVLEIACSLGSRTGLIFPSPKGGMLYTKDLADVLHRLDIAAVPHGFRSTFRTWCGDTGVLWEQAEASISHAVGSKVERAYARGDLLERRRPVMESWAQYLCGDAVPVLSDFPEHPAARRRRMRHSG